MRGELDGVATSRANWHVYKTALEIPENRSAKTKTNRKLTCAFSALLLASLILLLFSSSVFCSSMTWSLK